MGAWATSVSRLLWTGSLDFGCARGGAAASGVGGFLVSGRRPERRLHRPPPRPPHQRLPVQPGWFCSAFPGRDLLSPRAAISQKLGWGRQGPARPGVPCSLPRSCLSSRPCPRRCRFRLTSKSLVHAEPSLCEVSGGRGPGLCARCSDSAPATGETWPRAPAASVGPADCRLGDLVLEPPGSPRLGRLRGTLWTHGHGFFAAPRAWSAALGPPGSV